MKKVFIWIALIACISYSTAMAQTCSCGDILKQVISKTESDYAGYIHKVKEKDSSKYVKLRKQLMAEAPSTSFFKCYDLLEKYVSFFNDGHLFIGEFPANQPDSLPKTAKSYQLPANYEAALAKNKQKDSIEGIWRAANKLEVAIIKTGKDKFAAVTRQISTPKWTAGMVKFELEKTGENEYSITYYRSDFAKIHFTKLHISKNSMLAFGVYRFAKVSPSNPETKYINYNDPQLPVFKVLDKNNALLTIPSALINGRYLDSILIKNETIITSTPNLIIDVRSNGGGNYIWGSLYEIANTIVKPEPKTPGKDDFLLLASEDDAKYIAVLSKRSRDSMATKYYDAVIKKIRSHIGSIIGFSFYSSRPDTATRKVYEYPKRIAIIMDKQVASAGEAFVLGIKDISTKVVLYGSNTHGMIDYMNVNTVPVGTCDWYYFGYPTFFAADIKTNPHNPTGIKPDIYVPAATNDWIEWVKNDLNKK